MGDYSCGSYQKKATMATQMTFQRRGTVKPPEKGSFPLDHEGECKQFMKKYMRCLRENKQSNTKCRQESMDYLNCRMDKNLMLKEDWKKLGYSDLAKDSNSNTSSSSSNTSSSTSNTNSSSSNTSSSP